MEFPLIQPNCGEKVSGDRLWKWRQWALMLATNEGIPVTEVDWLLQSFVPQLDTLALRLETYRSASCLNIRCSLESLTEKWEKRVYDRIPVQHLTGMTSWRNFSLCVSPAVLIPRPETELIIDLAKQATHNHPPLLTGPWVDMGTGSGAIALGLADAFSEATVYAIDCSADALSIARHNASFNGMGDRIQFIQGSWFEPITHLQGDLKAIVSNPPYIPANQIAMLQPEVSNHEPHVALNGGPDGLDAIRHLARYGSTYLMSGGVWIVEMMAGQAGVVIDILAEHPFENVQIHKDLEGIERFALAYRS